MRIKGGIFMNKRQRKKWLKQHNKYVNQKTVAAN